MADGTPRSSSHGNDMDRSSILVGPEAVAKILAFIRSRPQGVPMPELIAKYQLVSDDVIRAAIHILEERGAVSVDRRSGYVISARQDQN